MRLPLYSPDQSVAEPGGAAPASEEREPAVCGVRYGAMNWIGEFRIPPRLELRCGAKVVVQTDRGIELGQQVALTCPKCPQAVTRSQIKEYVKNSGPEFYRPKAGKVLRIASPQDVREHELLNASVREDIDRCALMAAQLGLDMQVVTAEHLLGGERIVFYFRAEGRVDFRQLVRQLAHHYQTRIEMRQVGARDEARLVADYEVCGRECCCKNFLKKLRPVTMRMAKLQKSTLDPTKVSGRCGRLRCCLRYEHQCYDELNARLPRKGTRVQTEYGVGVVVDRQILTQLLMVRFEDNRIIAVPHEETAEPGQPLPHVKPPPEPQPQPESRFRPEEPEEQPGDKPRRSRRRRGRRPPRGDKKAAPAQPAEQSPADGSEKPAPPPRDDAGSQPADGSAQPSAPGDRERQAQAASRRRRRRRGRSRRKPTR